MQHREAQRDAQEPQGVLQAIGEEVEVFENAQHGQVDGHAGGKQEAALGWIGLALDPQGAEIVEESGEQQQAQEAVIPPAVEQITRHDQHPVLAPVPQPEI